MEKFETKFQFLKYDENNSVVIQKWRDNTIKMNGEDFKREMLFLADFFRRYHPQRVLILMQDFEFIVDPELQDWVNENVNSILAEDKTKTAIVVSKDFFSAVSVEQTIADAEKEGLENRFFDKEQDAQDWLGL
jgi:hypothetical protein